jgi:hypothetical protein
MMTIIYAACQNNRVMPSLTESLSHPQNDGSQLPANRPLARHPFLQGPLTNTAHSLQQALLKRVRRLLSNWLHMHAQHTSFARIALHTDREASSQVSSSIIFPKRAGDSLNHPAPRPSSTGMPIARTAPRARGWLMVVQGIGGT